VGKRKTPPVPGRSPSKRAKAEARDAAKLPSKSRSRRGTPSLRSEFLQTPSLRSEFLHSSKAKRLSAARRIQRAYRRFRAQFPDGGRLHSRSSPSPVVYQNDERMTGELSRRFGSALIRLARMLPDERDAELGAALSSGALRFASGMVRAGFVPATGKVAFTGGSGAEWARRGYEAARENLPAVSDLNGKQITYALIKVQLEDAPALAAKIARAPRARLLRTVARRKSISPRHGLRTREVIEVAAPSDVIVGAPGDSFAVPSDLRRFMGHALGDFSRYRWQMNPRRRRRVALPAGFRAKRWIMHSNLGVGPRALYAWLRAMFQWRDRVAARRNWESLYPRPLLMAGRRSETLGATLRDLLRRHVFGLSPPQDSPGAAASASAAASEPLSAYAQALRAAAGEAGRKERDDRRPASSVGSFFGASRTRPRRPYTRNVRVAGIVGDGRHAGAFVLYARRYDRGWQIQVAIIDPLASITFPLSVQGTVQRALADAVLKLGLGPGGASVGRIGVPVIDVQVALLPVPRKLAVQYASEGSCGPSSVALLLSLLRSIKTSSPKSSPSEAVVRAFRGVRDEDVVLAMQLHHNAVL